MIGCVHHKNLPKNREKNTVGVTIRLDCVVFGPPYQLDPTKKMPTKRKKNGTDFTHQPAGEKAMQSAEVESSTGLCQKLKIGANDQRSLKFSGSFGSQSKGEILDSQYCLFPRTDSVLDSI